jgi:DNA mismatch repair protein MutL
MRIHRLPPETVNRIAAGEVVERPASAIKELVENALDAGARQIEVQVEGGGLTRILVADDGFGLSPEELLLAVERHATSKLLPDDAGDYDLLRIATLGFRGEALPSIGSVARLSITSRARGASDAHALRVDGGAMGQVSPAAFPGPHGARVEVRDLFYATPARLKFMKSERAEAMAIAEEIKRQAMAHEAVSFSLEIDGRKVLRLPAEAQGDVGRLARLSAIMGREFSDNALLIDHVRRPADPEPRQRRPPVSVRQWPTGARPPAAGRPARRLCRLSGPRPPPADGSVPGARSGPGGCERPPGQGRGEVP